MIERLAPGHDLGVIGRVPRNCNFSQTPEPFARLGAREGETAIRPGAVPFPGGWTGFPSRELSILMRGQIRYVLL